MTVTEYKPYSFDLLQCQLYRTEISCFLFFIALWLSSYTVCLFPNQSTRIHVFVLAGKGVLTASIKRWIIHIMRWPCVKELMWKILQFSTHPCRSLDCSSDKCVLEGVNIYTVDTACWTVASSVVTGSLLLYKGRLTISINSTFHSHHTSWRCHGFVVNALHTILLTCVPKESSQTK